MSAVVYVIEYKPTGSSYPDAEQIGGSTDRMELEDPSPDGGIGITVARHGSGRRYDIRNAPTQVRWLSRRPLQDFEETGISNVSGRMRELIEEIEPGVHQFIPVDFVDKQGSLIEKRWFWQVCSRLDSVDRVETNWALKRGVVWSSARVPEPRLVFNNDAIKKVHFWRDKHLTIGIIMSDRAKKAFEAASMSGMKFHFFGSV